MAQAAARAIRPRIHVRYPSKIAGKVVGAVAAIIVVGLFGIARPVMLRAQTVSGPGSYATGSMDAQLRRVISVPMQKLSIPDALRAITAASGIRFIYRSESIPAQLVSIDTVPRKVSVLLALVLRGTGLVTRVAAPGELFILRASDINTDRDTTIVTGYVVATRLPPVPVRGTVDEEQSGPDLSYRRSPVSTRVITSAMLAQRGVRTLADLFHGDIPGVIAFDQGSDVNAVGTTALQVRGTVGPSTLHASLKTYVDGVEMADATFVNHIDAKTIDRVELTLGPAATTMDGAGAINGVMHIYTKHGVPTGQWTPAVHATVSGGMLSGRGRSSTFALLQEHAIALDGGRDRVTYHVAGGYSADGRYSSGESGAKSGTAASRNVFALAGTRLTSDAWDTDLSWRLNRRHFGASADQFYAFAMETGQVAYNRYRVVPFDRPGTVLQRGVAASEVWRATSWMDQRVTAGLDQQVTHIAAAPTLATVADSLPALADGSGTRVTGTWRMTTNTPIPGWSARRLHTIAGVETWTYRYTSTYAGLIDLNPSGPTSPGGVINTSYRTSSWNAGYFIQTAADVSDRLVVTAGVRAGESGRGFSNGSPLPRFGLAYVRDLGGSANGQGATTMKLRASYGAAGRAPCAGCREGITVPFAIIEANPRLQGETQRGGEAGIDLAFGSRATLQVTGYSQSVDNFLIELRTSPIGASIPVYQYRNGGRVRNRGVEASGTVRAGKVVVAAAYALTDGHLTVVTEALPGGLQVGDHPLLVARHSGSLSASYSASRYRMTVGSSYVGTYKTLEERLGESPGAVLGERPDSPLANMAIVVRAPADFRLYANGALDFGAHFSLFARGDNLNNAYGMALSHNVAGRRVTVGVGVRM